MLFIEHKEKVKKIIVKAKNNLWKTKQGTEGKRGAPQNGCGPVPTLLFGQHSDGRVGCQWILAETLALNS